jgi:hypothetical protein
MVVQFVPAGLLGHTSRPVYSGTGRQSPFSHRPFPLWGSTGDKQTLNGLFYVPLSPGGDKKFKMSELFSPPPASAELRDNGILFYL